jgi:NAD(P)-dependent dehydrogenase (short-subunit alcohol dehydrogenase family)
VGCIQVPNKSLRKADNMTGKVAVVTGAASGLGAEVALLLARHGYDLVLINRNRIKTEPLLQKLAEAHPKCTVGVVEADLADQDAIRFAATEVVQRHPKIDAVFNVAGVLLGDLAMSKHDNEMHFQVNTLAPYMLLRLLREPLAQAGQSAILNVSSGAIKLTGRLQIENLQRPPKIKKLTGAYAQSKLALTTLTNALAPDYATIGIVLRSMDPGGNKTAMTAGSGMPRALLLIRPLFFKSPAEGGSEIVAAALDPKYGRKSGLFIAGNRETKPPADCSDPEVQKRLLDLCFTLTGV